MKIIAKPVDMVCWFEKTGIPHPVRFKYTNMDLRDEIVRVDRVNNVEREKLAGNDMLIFNCQSMMHNNALRNYQLKYEIRTCKWILFKM